jgi:hypothetical protein
MRFVRFAYERTGGFVARAIRWFTKAPINHVAILFHSTDWDGDWVVEAVVEKGLSRVVCRPARGRKWWAVVTPKYDSVPYLQAAQEFVDQRYDFQGFFLFVPLILAWRWFRLKLKRPALAGKSQICSELATHVALPAVGYSKELADPQWVDPWTLYRVQKSLPELFEVKRGEGVGSN